MLLALGGDLGDGSHTLADAPLDEPFDVHGTRRVVVKAVGERVAEVIYVKVLGTPVVGPVEERTMMLVLLGGHAGWRTYTRRGNCCIRSRAARHMEYRRGGGGSVNQP
jgi:hypothetical protein